MKTSILLSTEFGYGDVVKSRIGEIGDEYIVIGYDVREVSPEGQVIGYTVVCSDWEGKGRTFYPIELEIVKREVRTE